jgi:hypothetical protein
MLRVRPRWVFRTPHAAARHGLSGLAAPAAGRVKAPMQRIADAWGENICGAVAAFVVPASLQCSKVEVLRYVGYGAMAVLALIVLWLGVKVLRR